MDSNLKTSTRSFKVCALVCQIKSVKTDLTVFFFFQNSFDFVSVVV